MQKKIKRIVRDIDQHWVADGFRVRSLFSYAEGSEFDPFLLLDFAGPHEFSSAEAKRGVGEHPHRGFETVTIVYQGELEHGDSSGSHGMIGAGDVQWMTAASGVVHEEFHSERFANEGGWLEMIQLWVNLPASEKMSPPRCQGLLNADIPSVSFPDGKATVRVIAGDFRGTKGSAKTFPPMNAWDIQLGGASNEELELPSGHTAMIVVQTGTARINGTSARAVELVQLERAGTQLHLEWETPARLLVLTGEPLGEPVVGQGPFVMNTREEIRQAIQDFQCGSIRRLTHERSET